MHHCNKAHTLPVVETLSDYHKSNRYPSRLLIVRSTRRIITRWFLTPSIKHIALQYALGTSASNRSSQHPGCVASKERLAVLDLQRGDHFSPHDWDCSIKELIPVVTFLTPLTLQIKEDLQ